MNDNDYAINLIAGANKTAPKKFKALRKILFLIIAIVAILIIVQILNAAKYDMAVNVKDGENILGVNPLTNKLDFGDLSRNNGMTRYITLKSSGDVPTYVAIMQFGDISDLVKINKNFFMLSPKEEAKLSFEILIPPSAPIKKYSGQVWIFRLPKLF